MIRPAKICGAWSGHTHGVYVAQEYSDPLASDTCSLGAETAGICHAWPVTSTGPQVSEDQRINKSKGGNRYVKKKKKKPFHSKSSLRPRDQYRCH